MNDTKMRGRRRGFSVLELMVVLTVIGVLLAMSAPSYQRATEQNQADIAAANLQAIWAAQRFYWLENHTYSATLAGLQDMLDPSVSASAVPYVYSIQLIDSNTFKASATRTGSSIWGGQIIIDQSGSASGVIQATGQRDIVPGFQ